MVPSFSKELSAGLAVIDKRRPKQNVAEVMNIIGEVKGKNILIVDDLIDTAGTLTNAAAALKDRGAVSGTACCTHAVLSGPAFPRSEHSPIEELLVEDTGRAVKASKTI